MYFIIILIIVCNLLLLLYKFSPNLYYEQKPAQAAQKPAQAAQKPVGQKQVQAAQKPASSSGFTRLGMQVVPINSNTVRLTTGGGLSNISKFNGTAKAKDGTVYSATSGNAVYNGKSYPSITINGQSAINMNGNIVYGSIGQNGQFIVSNRPPRDVSTFLNVVGKGIVSGATAGGIYGGMGGGIQGALIGAGLGSVSGGFISALSYFTTGKHPFNDGNNPFASPSDSIMANMPKPNDTFNPTDIVLSVG